MNDIGPILEEMTKVETPAAAQETPVETPVQTTTETPAQTVVNGGATETPVTSEDELIEVKETEQPVTTTASANAETPIQKPEDWFKQKYGKSTDEFDKEYQELQQLREAQSKRPDFVKTFEKLLADGVPAETIVRFGTLDVATLDADKRLDLLLEIENPSLTPQERQALINQKYPSDTDAFTEGAILAAQAQKKIDADAAGRKLKEIQGEKLKPVDTTVQRNQEAEAQELQRKASWAPKVKDLAQAVKRIEVPLGYSLHGEGGKTENRKFTYAYNMTAGDAAEIEQNIEAAYNAYALPANDDGFGKAKEIALRAWKVKNFDRLVNSAVSKAVSQLHEEHSKRAHAERIAGANGGRINTGDSTGAKDPLEQMITALG